MVGFLKKLFSAFGCYCVWTMWIIFAFIGIDEALHVTTFSDTTGFLGGVVWLICFLFVTVVSYIVIDGVFKDD